MAWDAGTITSATPHAALSTKIQALFNLDDTGGRSPTRNWSFVENIPAGTGAGQSDSALYSVDVYKCAGSGTDANLAAIDFYVAFAIPVSDGAVTSFVVVCESYDGSAGQKKFKRQCQGGTTGSAPVGSGYWYNDTYQTYAGLNGASRIATPMLNQTGMSYWIKITKDALLVQTRVGTTEDGWGASLFHSMTTVAESMPLIGGASAANQMAFNSLPQVTDAAITAKWSAELRAWTVLGSFSNLANMNDIWLSGKIPASRVLVTSTLGQTNAYLIGFIRGLLPSDFLIIPNSTALTGDTITIDGNTWIVLGAASNGGPLNLSSNSLSLVTRAI